MTYMDDIGLLRLARNAGYEAGLYGDDISSDSIILEYLPRVHANSNDQLGMIRAFKAGYQAALKK